MKVKWTSQAAVIKSEAAKHSLSISDHMMLEEFGHQLVARLIDEEVFTYVPAQRPFNILTWMWFMVAIGVFAWAMHLQFIVTDLEKQVSQMLGHGIVETTVFKNRE